MAKEAHRTQRDSLRDVFPIPNPAKAGTESYRRQDTGASGEDYIQRLATPHRKRRPKETESCFISYLDRVIEDFSGK